MAKHGATHVMTLDVPKTRGFSLICKITSKRFGFHYCSLPPEGALLRGLSNGICKSTLRRRAREREREELTGLK